MSPDDVKDIKSRLVRARKYLANWKSAGFDGITSVLHLVIVIQDRVNEMKAAAAHLRGPARPLSSLAKLSVRPIRVGGEVVQIVVAEDEAP